VIHTNSPNIGSISYGLGLGRLTFTCKETLRGSYQCRAFIKAELLWQLFTKSVTGLAEVAHTNTNEVNWLQAATALQWSGIVAWSRSRRRRQFPKIQFITDG